MKVLKFNSYLDGGTKEVVTDEGVFCFDERIKTTTGGRLYKGYPKDDNSNIIENSEQLEKQIIELLKEHKDDFYKELIGHFVNSRKK